MPSLWEETLNYSRPAIGFLLKHYFEIKNNSLDYHFFEEAFQEGYRGIAHSNPNSPAAFESVAEWAADLDRALKSLGDGWKGYYKYDQIKFNELTPAQTAVVIEYIWPECPIVVDRIQYFKLANRAVREITMFLNKSKMRTVRKVGNSWVVSVPERFKGQVQLIEDGKELRIKR